MPKYINTEQIEQYLHREEHGTPDERWRPESEFAEIIDQIPSADVTEVVRCKNCYYYTAGFLELKKASPLMSGYKVVGMCHTFNGLQSPADDDFCSRGKRRETE